MLERAFSNTLALLERGKANLTREKIPAIRGKQMSKKGRTLNGAGAVDGLGCFRVRLH